MERKKDQTPEQLSRHLLEVYFGGNWTVSCLSEQVRGISWQQATTSIHGQNRIAALVYHIHYFIAAQLRFFRDGILDAQDKYSFDHPPIGSQADWEAMLHKCWSHARQAAELIAQLPEDKLAENFADKKYGSYYRNILGVIEHTHYHLGQIALIKKMILAEHA